jgi:predicted nucleic acid-binding protein
MIVVSDTSPICYLLLIDQIMILQKLYDVVVIPQAVADELNASESPSVVRNWIANPPNWLQIEIVSASSRSGLEKLDSGEQEAILLAEQIEAELIILDDKAARQIASERGLRIIGLLGMIKDAAQFGLLDLRVTFERLQEAGFWAAPSLLERLLRQQ